MKQKRPKYLDLTDEVVFKRYFSGNKQVLLSLIKSFLPIFANASDLSLVNPNLADTSNGKQVVPDLCVQLSSGETINIEMKAHFEEHFLTKMLVYWAQSHLQQLKRVQKYDQVKPSYLLVFTMFDVFDEEDYINEITMTLHKHQGEQVGKDFNMVIVELNKFNQGPPIS